MAKSKKKKGAKKADPPKELEDEETADVVVSSEGAETEAATEPTEVVIVNEAPEAGDDEFLSEIAAEEEAEIVAAAEAEAEAEAAAERAKPKPPPLPEKIDPGRPKGAPLPSACRKEYTTKHGHIFCLKKKVTLPSGTTTDKVFIPFPGHEASARRSDVEMAEHFAK